MPVTVTQINTAEVLRYMGCPPERADGALIAQVEACARELLAVIRPRWSWRAADLALEEAGVRLEGGLLLPGRTAPPAPAGGRPPSPADSPCSAEPHRDSAGLR